MWTRVINEQALKLALGWLLATNSSAVATETTDTQVVAAVEKKYSEAKSIQAKIKKQLTLAVLEKEKEFSGQLFIQYGGFLKMEYEKPVRSFVLFENKVIWSVQYPEDPEFDNTIRVLKTKKPKDSQPQVILAFLLGEGEFLKFFNVKKVSENGDYLGFELLPKDKKSEIKKLVMNIDRKNLLIRSMSYWDQIENKTQIDFSNIRFDKTLPKDIFKFKLPSNAEVTEI